MKKYTYRFHYRSWVDITVEADNEDEASLLAQDRYNNGEFEDDPTEFENTHTELIKTEQTMRRLVIIDHESHALFIEDVSDETLAKYNGETEAFIKDNYCIHDNFSWDYITSAQYIPDCKDTEVYDIDFKEICK